MEKKVYRYSYLGNFVVNVVLVGALLLILWFDSGETVWKNRMESMTICMGVWMLLSLWGKAYRVDENYKGKTALDRRTTMLFTFALLLVESMTLYCSMENKLEFLLPSTVCLLIWLVAVGLSLMSFGKLKTVGFRQ
ncbi:MAG: hypothetical protein K2J82_02620 [Muribaculaceae bacterium]|nr:hypothetical protein [Muribaculaceae bacterium]MDE6753485.1 hypothetical protein [Muribaculaceae bacterium]